MASASSVFRTAWIGVCQRKFSCTISGMPALRHASTIAFASDKVLANGFWQMVSTLFAAAISTRVR